MRVLVVNDDGTELNRIKDMMRIPNDVSCTYVQMADEEDCFNIDDVCNSLDPKTLFEGYDLIIIDHDMPFQGDRLLEAWNRNGLNERKTKVISNSAFERNYVPWIPRFKESQYIRRMLREQSVA